jgi:hypothetical protein
MKDLRIMLAILFLLMVIVLTFVFPRASIAFVWVVLLRKVYLDNKGDIINFFNKQ